MEEDINSIVLNFKKNITEINKNKKDFETFINAPISNLKFSTETLLKNNRNFILNELKALNIRTIGNNVSARIQFLLNSLDKEDIMIYFEFIEKNYSKESLVSEMKTYIDEYEEIESEIEQWRIINKGKVSIELENKKKLCNEKIHIFEVFNARLKSIYSTFDELIPQNIFGDETLSLENLKSVYFDFPETEKRYLTSFVKELRRIQSDTISLIQRISLENNSVFVWFNTIEEAESFYANKTFVQAIYEKFLRRLQKNKIEISWGVNYEKNI